MDESLVLMKRRLCWSLEDVVYFALKVNKRKPSEPMAPTLREKILKMNWFDNMLYQHFNQSLWQQIAKEPRFEEELARFREAKDRLSGQCDSTASMDEELHRKKLMETPLTEAQKQCHLAQVSARACGKRHTNRWAPSPAGHRRANMCAWQMDSVGFVKLLKYEWNVPDAECNVARPRKQVRWRSLGPSMRPTNTSLSLQAARAAMARWSTSKRTRQGAAPSPIFSTALPTNTGCGPCSRRTTSFSVRRGVAVGGRPLSICELLVGPEFCWGFCWGGGGG
jgi:hypothetical protein